MPKEIIPIAFNKGGDYLMAATAAAKNKKIRQEALREQLSKGKHVDHVIEIAKKLNDQHLSLESTHIAALKASADIKLKLINKYVPDLKAVEHSQDPESPITELSNSELSDAIATLTAKLNES